MGRKSSEWKIFQVDSQLQNFSISQHMLEGAQVKAHTSTIPHTFSVTFSTYFFSYLGLLLVFAAHFCLLLRPGNEDMAHSVLVHICLQTQHPFMMLQDQMSDSVTSIFRSLIFESGAVYISMSVHVMWEVEHSFAAFSSSCTPV